MNLLQRIAFWMAKKYLKAHHYRLSGYADDLVFASGDMLVSPGAKRVMGKFNMAKAKGRNCVIEASLLDGPQDFIGIEPPKIRIQG